MGISPVESISKWIRPGYDLCLGCPSFVRASFVPLPAADLADEIMSRHVEVEGSHGDIAFTEAGDVGLGSLDVKRGSVSHPVISAAPGVLAALETLAVAPQAHGDDADSLGLAARMRGEIDVEQRPVRRLVGQDLLDH